MAVACDLCERTILWGGVIVHQPWCPRAKEGDRREEGQEEVLE